MTDRFRPGPEASAELEDAALWYEGQRLGLGLELVQAVDVALAQIAGWPQIGRRVTGLPDDVPARKVPESASPTTSSTCLGKVHSGFWRSRTTAVNLATGFLALAGSSLVSPTRQMSRAPRRQDDIDSRARRLHLKVRRRASHRLRRWLALPSTGINHHRSRMGSGVAKSWSQSGAQSDRAIALARLVEAESVPVSSQ